MRLPFRLLPATACRRPAPRRSRGFTLVEMSVVLVVIGLIIGAVAVGRDLQRNASYQRIASNFVQGWLMAYDAYATGTGIVPGDSATAPTGRVNGNTTALCGAALLNTFLAAGIRLPEGRTEGQADRYAYLDSNGNPQEVQVCFQNVTWAEPGASVGTYVARQRNVMVLRQLTPALATLVDSQVDGSADARFGRMREDSQAGLTAVVASVPWSVDERMAIGSNTPTALDESQVAVVNGWVLMSR